MVTGKNTQWEKRQKELDSIPILRATIASQEETIALLTTQLTNERLKNNNLETLVKCTCKNKKPDKNTQVNN